MTMVVGIPRLPFESPSAKTVLVGLAASFLLHSAALVLLSLSSDAVPRTAEEIVAVEVIEARSEEPSAEGREMSSEPRAAEPEATVESVQNEMLTEAAPAPADEAPISRELPPAPPVSSIPLPPPKTPWTPAHKPTAAPSRSNSTTAREKPAAAGGKNGKLSNVSADSSVPTRPVSVDSCPEADYPLSARRRGQEGRVVVRMDVGPNGAVESAAVITSSGVTALDEAAMAASRNCRFSPAVREGVAIAGRIDQPFNFRFAGSSSEN